MIKGFKCFDKDMKCRGFQFEVGKTYEHKGPISMCESGFHYCEKAQDIFNYYNFDPTNRVCAVESPVKDTKKGEDKNVTSCLTILRELTWHEVLDAVNTGRGNSGDSNSGHWNSGHRNSGHWNSGHRNSGHSNSGHSNSGHRNSGHWNSGHWNSGDSNSGLFCTNTPNVRLFNRYSKVPWSDPRIQAVLGRGPDTTEWVYFSEMTAEEKEKHPKAETTGGYLKKLEYKAAWQKYWGNASEQVKNDFQNLPFFNAEIFHEITGIKVAVKEKV